MPFWALAAVCLQSAALAGLRLEVPSDFVPSDASQASLAPPDIRAQEIETATDKEKADFLNLYDDCLCMRPPLGPKERKEFHDNLWVFERYQQLLKQDYVVSNPRLGFFLEERSLVKSHWLADGGKKPDMVERAGALVMIRRDAAESPELKQLYLEEARAQGAARQTELASRLSQEELGRIMELRQAWIPAQAVLTEPFADHTDDPNLLRQVTYFDAAIAGKTYYWDVLADVGMVIRHRGLPGDRCDYEIAIANASDLGLPGGWINSPGKPCVSIQELRHARSKDGVLRLIGN